MGLELLNTRNFDSPDGENCLPKAFHSTKVFGLVGAYVSLYDIIGLSNPKGAMQTMSRMARFTFPAAGAGGVYAATACMLGDIRGQDGPLNHIVGGAAAGAVLSTQFKNVKWGIAWACGLAAICGIIKAAKMDGLDITPKHIPMKGSFMNRESISLAGNRKELSPSSD